MNRPHLTDHELALVRDVFGRHPEVSRAILFGSRAKGTHAPHSDVDLAITGDMAASIGTGNPVVEHVPIRG